MKEKNGREDKRQYLISKLCDFRTSETSSSPSCRVLKRRRLAAKIATAIEDDGKRENNSPSAPIKSALGARV